MRYILLSLLIAGACWGQPYETQTLEDNGGYTAMVDTLRYSRGHDTLFWYVAKIDTLSMVRECVSVPDNESMAKTNLAIYIVKDSCYFNMQCDTTWAKKVQVWLTPEELKRLKELVAPVRIEQFQGLSGRYYDHRR